jgi:riboflavin synthase
MFTGIVEATGEVVSIDDTDEGRRLGVSAPFSSELEHGQSVAVSGACLTVEAFDEEAFELFCSAETLERTYLDAVSVGDRVNLERALPADGRFDGHFVQGHVDGVGEVTGVERIGDDWTFGFSLPADLERYVVEKGSIAVDGISLTVAELRDGDFDVAVIPATYELTTLSGKSVGDPVHLEVDVVAKYVERLTEGYR